uniref:5'-nucleotidase n=1 Tax=Opuntia streptacantha TaxID=393608 RepID=A0A7C8ZL86_OPUST
MNRNALPPSLVANLQQVLISRKNTPRQEDNEEEKVVTESTELTQSTIDGAAQDPSSSSSISSSAEDDSEEKSSKPVILVTNGDGIESPGLVSLVDALVRDGRFDVHVCAPQFDKSASGHSLTVSETVEVTSTEVSGATAFEVSGTPADCVSLALSQTLFSWSKPVLVISGINRGSSCGQNMLYSGAIAGAREALVYGVPSLCISLDWKKDVSSENDFKDAVEICLPLINAAIRDIEKGIFPQSCFLSVEVPVSPSTNKGFKLTRQSLWRSGLTWRAVSSYKHPSAMNFMANQQSLGIQLAQLGRDASAAGAARRLHKNKKNVEIESVGVAGKLESEQTIRKHYRLEFLNEGKEDADEDEDFKAVQSGFVAVTPLALSSDNETQIRTSVSNWLSLALAGDQ